MIQIDNEMSELINGALADGVPCMLGTASKDGQPQISMKGSVMVYDQDSLAYWERSKRTALANLGGNPQVVVFYRNPEQRIHWRFHGTATIFDSGTMREDVMGRTVPAELERDPDRTGVAVVIKLSKITELSGNVLQERD